MARFINAPHSRQVIFVRGATEGINLVAQSYGRSHFKKNDEIILTIHEHHSNIVPWQLICEQTGALIKVVPMDDRGVLDMEVYEKLLNDRTRLVAVSHISNAIGTINPVADIIAKAHAREVPVLVDGAQWVPHFPVDVQALDCDFLSPLRQGGFAERYAALSWRGRYDSFSHLRKDYLQGYTRTL